MILRSLYFYLFCVESKIPLCVRSFPRYKCLCFNVILYHSQCYIHTCFVVPLFLPSHESGRTLLVLQVQMFSGLLVRSQVVQLFLLPKCVFKVSIQVFIDPRYNLLTGFKQNQLWTLSRFPSSVGPHLRRPFQSVSDWSTPGHTVFQITVILSVLSLLLLTVPSFVNSWMKISGPLSLPLLP